MWVGCCETRRRIRSDFKRAATELWVSAPLLPLLGARTMLTALRAAHPALVRQSLIFRGSGLSRLSRFSALPHPFSQEHASQHVDFFLSGQNTLRCELLTHAGAAHTNREKARTVLKASTSTPRTNFARVTCAVAPLCVVLPGPRAGGWERAHGRHSRHSRWHGSPC